MYGASAPGHWQSVGGCQVSALRVVVLAAGRAGRAVGRPQATQPKERGRSQSRGCTTVSIQSVLFIIRIHYSLVVLENMQINQIIKVNSDVI